MNRHAFPPEALAANPTYKLSEQERVLISTMAHLRLWTSTAIAEAWGVSRKTVTNCAATYVPLGR